MTAALDTPQQKYVLFNLYKSHNSKQTTILMQKRMKIDSL